MILFGLTLWAYWNISASRAHCHVNKARSALGPLRVQRWAVIKKKSLKAHPHPETLEVCVCVWRYAV